MIIRIDHKTITEIDDKFVTRKIYYMLYEANKKPYEVFNWHRE